MICGDGELQVAAAEYVGTGPEIPLGIHRQGRLPAGNIVAGIAGVRQLAEGRRHGIRVAGAGAGDFDPQMFSDIAKKMGINL